MPDDADILALQLEQHATPIPAQDFGDDITWTDVRFGRQDYENMRPRILRRYGPQWDATQPDFFENSRNALDGGEIGLIMPRHPEMGNSQHPEYVPIFTRAIHNALSEAVRSNTPMVLATCNNDLSRENIHRAVEGFWQAAGAPTNDRWQCITQPNPPHIVGVIDGRVMDSYMWVFLPAVKTFAA